MECSVKECMTKVTLTMANLPRVGNATVCLEVHGKITDHDVGQHWASIEAREVAIGELKQGVGPTEAYENTLLKIGEKAPTLHAVKKMNCRLDLTGLPSDQIKQIRMMAEIFVNETKMKDVKVKGYIQVLSYILNRAFKQF